jgi:hypothetical protein
MLYNEPQYVQPPIFDIQQTAADLTPIYAYITESHRPSLVNDNVWNINANETTVQSGTVQAHIEDTYTPGDRVKGKKVRSRSSSGGVRQTRQAPRTRGYPCVIDGCEQIFNRACELK